VETQDGVQIGEPLGGMPEGVRKALDEYGAHVGRRGTGRLVPSEILDRLDESEREWITQTAHRLHNLNTDLQAVWQAAVLGELEPDEDELDDEEE